MPASISPPSTDPAGLEQLAPLWQELHRHHREVSDYTALVEDLAVSWERRLRWYRRLLGDGAAYLTASDDGGRLIGYAVVMLERVPDDTFESAQGVAEVATLVVAEAHRSSGLGQRLLHAAERLARRNGFDVMKIYVMAGNRRAHAFYEMAGYAVGEYVLYRQL